jgi:protein-tyrosine-phosphatase
MAEGILLDRVTSRVPIPGVWKVGSAGVNAQEGLPASRFSTEVMAERGIDIRNHLSRSITAELLAETSLVLTMEKIHKSILVSRFPGSSNRIFMLSEMFGQESPVDDPFGASLEDYRLTADVISRMIEAGQDRIVELSSQDRG